ncbi:MAG TPA: AMP-binding protein [Kiritimatiellia bacterium]|mgnify:CR=1 FL=1|nr:AMP-binding protein [Kiritimatiellia bacterium]
MTEFWHFESNPAVRDASPALIDTSLDVTICYKDLRHACQSISSLISPTAPRKKTLGFILCRNQWPAVAGYLAALRSGHAVCLLPDNLSEAQLTPLLQAYQPTWIIAPASNIAAVSALDVTPFLHQSWSLAKTPFFDDTDEINQDLALLLSTSGSTGSSKMVRLSFTNLAVNAQQIANYLGLTAQERPVTSLSMPYSYGLSVVNSHLAAGAALVMTDSGITSPDFWNIMKSKRVTSIAGVPFLYQTLQRLKLEDMDLPDLKTLTQAGGRMPQPLLVHFVTMAQRKGWRFFAMYGQTEAAPRIAYVPPERMPEKAGSIGIAIPGGKLSIDIESNELIYEGANVMMGYAQSRADLARPNELNGVLRTGDLARQDNDGFFWITGRLTRLAKVVGYRLNLDELEKEIERAGISPVALWENDGTLHFATSHQQLNDRLPEFARSWRLPLHLLISHVVDTLPNNINGKVDYILLRDIYS